MTRKISFYILSVFAILFPATAFAAEPDGLSKKLIQLGWDMPTTRFLKEHHRSMQATTPFDGTMFEVRVLDGEGKTHSTNHFWDTTPWKPEWFEGPLADLKACEWTSFDENFLRLNATPGTIAWNDDAGWKILCEKTAMCGRFLKQVGMKGLAPDFESYGAEMFRYDPKSGLSFAETERLARQRGREFLAAFAREFPEAVVLSLWLNSINFRAGRSENPTVILSIDHYGLLPAFINGMFDAAPPEMVLVDGCENGYYLNGESEYFQTAVEMISWTGPAMRLIAPENRLKYRSQGQAGFGFYLDMFSNPEGHQHYRGPKDGGTRLDRLRENLSAALAAADQYVWVYGEHQCWWGPGTPWETAIPGLTETLRQIKDPVGAARTVLDREKQAGTAVNLLHNPSFEKKSDSSSYPDGWAFWQDDKTSSGQGTWDGSFGNGSTKLSGIAWGCFLQPVPAKEGERYYVSAQAKSVGYGYPYFVIRWQAADGSWVRVEADRRFDFLDGKAEGVVVVPAKAEKLVVQIAVRNQESADDICWFDEIELYRIP